MNNAMLRIFWAGVVAAMVGGGIAAQNQQRDKPAPPQQPSVVQADESFELDVKEKRITEKNYKASKSVEIESKDPKTMHVQVGAALSADSIDVLLRNVTGSVRFRGSLQRIVNVIKARSPGY
jgi:hypothetical protein